MGRKKSTTIHPEGRRRKLFLFTPRFQDWTHQIARRYNAPVYLVGSAIRRSDPRDIDIRVILSDEAFEARYGSVQDWMAQGESGQWGEIRQRWAEECETITEQARRQLGIEIDFRIEPQSEVDRRYKDEPHLRLA